MYIRSEPLQLVRPPQPDDPDCTFIYGAPRGGTSMVAGLLRILGVWVVDRELPGNNEDLDIIEARGPVEHMTDPDGPEVEAAIERMSPILLERAAAGRPWGWKDPHGCFYAHRLQGILGNIRTILVMRDPLAAAMRVNIVQKWDLIDGLDDTLMLYRRGLDFLTASTLPAAIISYEKALVRPERLVEQLIDYCSLEPASEKVEEAIAFCYPERGHGSPSDPGWPRQGAL